MDIQARAVITLFLLFFQNKTIALIVHYVFFVIVEKITHKL